MKMYIKMRKRLIIFGAVLALLLVAIQISVSRAEPDSCPAKLDVMIALDRSASMNFTSKCDWWQFKCINAPSCSLGYQWVKNTTYNQTQTWCNGKNQPAPHQSVWVDYGPVKFTAAKQAAKNFLDLLGTDDQSGLVSFTTTATLNKTLSNNHPSTKTAIDGLTASGSVTDIANAINLSNQELQSARAGAQASKTIILLTDGMVDQDPTTMELRIDDAIARANEAAAAGIKIYTVGIGSEINPTILQTIASTTGGKYYFASTTAELNGIFTSLNTDMCSQQPVCGDGIVNGNEQCDDGNTTDDDGCSATCQTQPAKCSVTTTCGDACSYGGVTYNTVLIGSQCWFKENLNIGSMITNLEIPNDPAPTLNDPSTVSKWCYNNSSTYCTDEGGLYAWAETNALPNSCNSIDCNIPTLNQGICPSGWHIPSDAEFYILENYLTTPGQTCDAERSGWGCSGAGTKLILGGSSGFDAIGAGNHETTGPTSFFDKREPSVHFWSSTHFGENYSIGRGLIYLYTPGDMVARGWGGSIHGLSVRCLSNTTKEICGDGIINNTEECDDGNNNNNDACSNACQTVIPEPVCGNGIPETGEQCEDGNTIDGDGCSALCIPELVCGNRIVESGEQCDDGNLGSGDGCSATCQIEIPTPIGTTTSLYIIKKTYDLTSGIYYFLEAKCNLGDIVITGGVSNYSSGVNKIEVKRSAPWDEPEVWNIDVKPQLDGKITILIKCLRIAP